MYRMAFACRLCFHCFKLTETLSNSSKVDQLLIANIREYCRAIAASENLKQRQSHEKGNEQAIEKNAVPEKEKLAQLSEEKSDHFGTLEYSLEAPRTKQTFRKSFQRKHNRTSKFESLKGITAKEKTPDESDVFGTLAKPFASEKLCKLVINELEDYDEDDEGVMASVGFHAPRPPTHVYEKDIDNLVDQRKIKQALEHFKKIVKVNKVKPTHFMYTRLISGCGQVGYTKMAFLLFKEMCERGLTPSPATLTALFNSCAEGPFPDYGLQQALYLYDKMKDKNWIPSNITYHAMIKAFGRCGDIETAFKVLDEMKKEKHAITSQTFAFVLQGCISDKDSGFILALKVYHMMLKMKIKLETYSFNLLLRAIRDCGLGSPELVKDFLEGWKAGHQKLPEPDQREKLLLISKPNLIESSSSSQENMHSTASDFENISASEDNFIETDVQTVALIKQTSLPNLLFPKKNFPGEIVSLSEVTESHQRLAICGGTLGMLQLFESMNSSPDIRTFTLLLECIPSTTEAENELLWYLNRSSVKQDVDFYNILIKKRNFRNDFQGALEALKMISEKNLCPDIVTFGVLALGCTTRESAHTFLTDMKNSEIKPNEEILNTLIGNACIKMNFGFLLDMMNVAKEEGISIQKDCIQKIERAKEYARKILLDKERGKEINGYLGSSHFEEGYKKFCLYYKQLLKSLGVEIPQHPWKQYEPAPVEELASKNV